jgi:hypothetical protein
MADTQTSGSAVPNPSVERTQTTVAQPIVDAKTPQVNTPQSGDVKDAAAEVMRKHKVKVDGAELEVDEDELKRGYSHQKAASKLMQEAQRSRKQAETFISMMKDKGKLFEAIQQLGHDPRKLAEEYLAAQLEEEVMDPKDRELKTLRSKLEREEQTKAEAEKERLGKINAALTAKYAKEYETQFIEALKTTQLPPTKETVAQIAGYIKRAAEIKIKMTPEEAALLVKDDLQRSVTSVISQTDGDTLIKLLGEETANKIRKWDTSRAKDPNQGLKNTDHANPKREKREVKRMSHAEWREYNRAK